MVQYFLQLGPSEILWIKGNQGKQVLNILAFLPLKQFQLPNFVAVGDDIPEMMAN